MAGLEIFSDVCFTGMETGRERVREISASFPPNVSCWEGWVTTGIGSPSSTEGMKKILYIQLTVLIISVDLVRAF